MAGQNCVTPKIKKRQTQTIGELLDNVLMSIASEEDAIALVIYAETQKIQWSMDTMSSPTLEPVDPEKIRALLKAVRDMINSLRRLERLLRDKMWMTLRLKECNAANAACA